MLQLRQAQIDSLAAAWFEQRLVRLIADTIPAARDSVNTEAGKSFLRQQSAQAQHHGLVVELDVARFAITAWLLGPDFDSRIPAFAEILRDLQLTAAQKSKAIELIASNLLAELRASAPAP